jgi:hypothetical protein
MAGRDPRIQYIIQQARADGLDPEAVLAIAGHEGLSGGIGDGGHAFGPFQENNAGGVLTGRFKGQTPAQLNAWAWSHAGINDALNRIAAVAGGLKGNAAINAITTRFERPANPQAEIADAEAHYGHYGAGGPVNVQGGVSVPGTPGAGSIVAGGNSLSRQQLAQLAFASPINFGSNQVQAPNLMALIEARQHQAAGGAGAPAPVTPRAPGNVSPGGYSGGGVTFTGDTTGVDTGLLAKISHAGRAAGVTQIKVTSGYRDPGHNAAVGGVGHSNHLSGHALDGEAFIPGKGWVPLGQALLPVAGKFGLRSGDVPGFYNGGTDPVHVDDGWNQTH